MPITTTTTLPAPVQQSFSYKLLSVPVPKYIGYYKSSLIDLETEVQ